MINSEAKKIEDEVLWTNIQQNSLSAFEQLYDRFFKPLFNYGRKVSNSSSTVEDAIHDLFLDVWRYRENLSKTTSVKFYLYRSLRRRIVKNQTEDFDSANFDFQVDELLHRKDFSIEEDIIEKEKSKERSVRLTKHLSNLSPRQYECLVLKFYDELSYPEIAVMLNVNEQSARNLVQRALEQLRLLSKIVTTIMFFVVTLF